MCVYAYVQCGSVAVWQCGSVAVWQCGSVAVWQCGSVAVWQCGSVPVPVPVHINLNLNCLFAKAARPLCYWCSGHQSYRHDQTRLVSVYTYLFCQTSYKLLSKI